LNLSAINEQLNDDRENSEIENETERKLINILLNKPSHVIVVETPDPRNSDHKNSTIINTRRDSLPINRIASG